MKKNGKPKLLIIGPLPPPYLGPAVATDRLRKSPVINESFDVRLLHLDDPGGHEDIGQLSWNNISTALRHGFRFLRMILKDKPDVMYVPVARGLWGFIRDLMFLLPARTLGIKTIVHLRAGRFDMIHDNGGFGRFIARLGLSGISCGIVLGETVRDVFGPFISGDRIRVMPNGMDLSSWRREMFKREQGDRVHIIYLANLFRNKGGHVLLKALPEVIRPHPDIRVTFAGVWRDECFREECMDLVEQGNLGDIVSFVGGVNDEQKKELLASGDILVFTPVKPEGLPWVVLEGMAAKLPVVGTPQGTMKEVIVEGETGYLVPPDDASALAARLGELIEDKELRERMGENGRKRVEEVYSEEHCHTTFVTIAREALGE